jgi:histidine triad (HIT) family protein
VLELNESVVDPREIDMSKSHADCLFCKMIHGQIPVPRVFENEAVICIKDIRPQAKIHLLVIPKEHVPSLEEAFPAHGSSKSELIGKLFQAATEIARKENLLPRGFRSVINTKDDAGQTVHHLHLHLLGGEPLNGDFA